MWRLVLFCVLLLPSALAVVVHMVAHSHDDVGWLKTPTQYYYGWNNSIQHANVELTYDSVVLSMQQDASRKFTVVEIAFFSKWYYSQLPSIQVTVRRYVNEGRMEFATGGWVSHDEATTHYLEILDQVSLGHAFIVKEFGADALPRVQWQVDPFGHTSGQVMLFSQDSGVDGLFFSRIDYQDFSARQQQQSREFLWAPSPSLGGKASVFASMMLHGSYCPPIDFNFDIILSEPNVVGVKHCALREDETAGSCLDSDNTATSWTEKIGGMANADWSVSRGDDILWTMGCDFTHMQAETWFVNMQRIIGLAANDTSGILWNTSFVMGTPSSYMDAKLSYFSQVHPTDVPVKLFDDFLPYADGPHMYWTGFYTSRPTLKRFIRIAGGFYVAVRQLSAHFRSTFGQPLDVQLIAEAVAQSQHHDAITGTAKQHVTFDYVKFLSAAINSVVRQIASDWAGAPVFLCLAANVSVCSVSSSGSEFIVFGWNSDSKPGTLRLELPLPSASWRWAASPGLDVHTAVVPSLRVADYHHDRSGSASADVGSPFTGIIHVHGVGPMSPFTLTASPAFDQCAPTAMQLSSSGVVETDAVQLTFDSTSGRLQKIVNKNTNTSSNVSLSVCYYVSSTGDAASSQASGAYIFRPQSATSCVHVWDGSIPAPLAVLSTSPVIVLEQNVTEWLTLRWYVSDVVAVDFTVLELPSEGEGRELVLKWTSNIESSNVFWTDSNGLELVPRLRNKRPFPFDNSEAISSNYYPVTSAAVLRDDTRDFMVAVDATVGCASLAAGELECMILRRTLVDDQRGVGEALNETEHVTSYVNCDWSRDCGRHYGAALSLRGRWQVALAPPSNATWRNTAESLYRKPLVLLAQAGEASQRFAAAWSNSSRTLWDAAALPLDVHVSSMDVLGGPSDKAVTLWVRLSHAGSCYSYASCLAGLRAVEVESLFTVRVASIVRTSLTSHHRLWRNGTSATEAILLNYSSALHRPSGFVFVNATTGGARHTVHMFPMELHAYKIELDASAAR